MKTNTMITKRILLIASALVASTVLLSDSNDENFLNKQLKASGKTSMQDYDPNEIVIKYRKNVPSVEMASRTVGLGLRLNEVSARPHFTTAFINQNETVEDAVSRVSRDPAVEYAEPKYKYYKSASAPNDADFGKLWGLKNNGQTISSPSYTTNNPGTSGKDMNVLGAWDLTSDCSSIIVAVLDTGVNYTHEDLVGNMWDGSGGCFNQNGTPIVGGCPNHGWDFASNDNNPRDEEGHGSHVAGTIGAMGNNSVGISGVCQKAKIMAVRVLGLGGGDNTTVSNGIYFAVRNGAKVINMSLGGTSYSSLIHDAIEYARTNNVLVVVAAGNENTNLSTGNSFPCKNTSANIVCIGALDQSYVRATFSNFDTNATVSSRTVDFGAPGTNIFSLYGEEVKYEEGASNYGSGWIAGGTGGMVDWGYRSCSFSINSTPVTLKGLYLPLDCSVIGFNFTPPYNSPTSVSSSMNRTVYKNFTIPNNSTNVNLYQTIISDGESIGSTCYDYTEMYTSSTAGNPYPSGTLIALNDSNRSNAIVTKFCRRTVNGVGYSFIYSNSRTLPACINSGTNCSIGYRYVSDLSVNNGGAVVGDFFLTAWAPSNTAYISINGTSMASPNAAGVAALIWAYNPSFTFTEVIQKLIDGGQTETSLTGTTRYGKAINANDSIKHLKQVTGVSVSLQ